MPTDKSKKIIFLCGVHAVGKTTLSEKISQLTNYKSLSASEIIKATKSNLIESEKIVKNVDNNQSALLDGIDKLLTKTDKYIIDGHFCLLESKDSILKIDFSIFEKISPKGIISVYEDANVIYNRLVTRDKLSWNISTIKNLQECELLQAKHVAKKLDIPLLNISSHHDVNSVITFIHNSFIVDDKHNSVTN